MRYAEREKRECGYCQRAITIGKRSRVMHPHNDERGQLCRGAGTAAHSPLPPEEGGADVKR
jgi:hypothetical protein